MSLALYLLAAIGAYCALRSVSSWVIGIQLLILALLFGGIIGSHLGSGAIPIVFRDGAIVLPLYTAFFLGKAGRSAVAQLPGDVALALCAVLAWLTVCLFNPSDISALRLLVGLKVWAYYIPLLFIGIGLAAQPGAMFRVFRVFLIAGLAACGIGLAQVVLVRVIGYAPAMALFFGEGAKAATQGFTFFWAGGALTRIPGTFSFGSQYVAFLYAYLTIAMIEINADPDPKFQKIARAAIFVCLLAGVVSGTKGALVTFPVFIAGYVAFGLVRNRLLMIAPFVIIGGVWLLATIGVDIQTLFATGAEHLVRYSQGFIFDEIASALDAGPLGQGIGTNTNAARYVGPEIAGFGRVIGLETYFAKITVEMGWIGLIVFSVFFVIISVHMLVVALRHFRQPPSAITAPLVIYMGFVIISLFKAWSLDIDPTNVFFWLAFGLVIGVDRVARRQALVLPAPVRLEEARGARA